MKKTIGIILLLCLVSFISFSQDDSTKISSLNEITITGVRADIKDPVSQTNLTKSQITKNYIGQDFNILASKTPSIIYYADGGNFTGYSYMRLRGLDQTRINFTLNNIPISEPEDQGFYASNFTDFLNNVGSIQIQRGVGSSTNGNSSYAGSINFDSPSLSDSAYTNIQTGIGSFNSGRLSVGTNTGILKSGFACYARFSNTYSDGYRYHSGTNASTFFISMGYYGKKDIIKLTAFSGKSKNSMAYTAVSIDDINKDPRTNYLSPDEIDDFNQQLVQLQHTRQTGSKSFLTSSVFYIGLQGNYGVLFSPSYMANFQLFSDMYGANSTWALICDKLKLRLGINSYTYYRNHSMSQAPNFNQKIYSNRGDKNEFSAFSKLSYDIGKLSLFSDLQIRTVNFFYRPSAGYNFSVTPITWTFFNPKAGISYRFNKNSNTYASIGQMHREPTRNDMFAGFDDMDTSNVKLIGNLTKVKPESVIDYEAGYKYYTSKINISSNLFFMQFKNEVAAVGKLSYIGLPLRANVASSQRYGIELEYNTQFFNHLFLSGNATFMKANIDVYTTQYDLNTYRNIQPLLTPNCIINKNISYSFFKNKLEIGGNLRYVSMSYLDNTDNAKLVLPEAFTFGTSTTYRPIKNMNISFVCNNVTNKRIFNGGYSVLGTAYYYISAPRNYYVSLSYTF